MVKPRENRVPIMMSVEELKAIDDWRFSNRVGTRSDAVRRLCQIGIRTSSHLGAIAASAESNLDKLIALNNDAADLLDGKLPEHAREAIGAIFLARVSEITEASIITRERAFDLVREIMALQDEDAFEKSLKRADDSRTAASERWEKTKKALANARDGDSK